MRRLGAVTDANPDDSHLNRQDDDPGITTIFYGYNAYRGEVSRKGHHLAAALICRFKKKQDLARAAAALLLQASLPHTPPSADVQAQRTISNPLLLCSGSAMAYFISRK
jgi:hypothetical protein